MSRTPKGRCGTWRSAGASSSVTLDAVDLAALAADADVLIESGAVPVDLDALRAANPGAGDGVDHAVRRGRSEGRLAGHRPRGAGRRRRARPRRRRGPRAGADGPAPGVDARRRRRRLRGPAGTDRTATRPVSASTSTSPPRRRWRQASQSFVLAESFHATKIERFGGGVRLGDLRLPLIYPAADGHVAISFVFGTAIGPFTARLMRWVHEAGFCDEAMRDTDWIGYGAELMGGKISIEEWARRHGLGRGVHGQPHEGRALRRRPRTARAARPGGHPSGGPRQRAVPRRARSGSRSPSADRTVRFPGSFAKLTATPLPRWRRLRASASTTARSRRVRRARRGDGAPPAAAERRLPLAGREGARSHVGHGRPGCVTACWPTSAPPSCGSSRAGASRPPGRCSRSGTTRSTSKDPRSTTT